MATKAPSKSQLEEMRREAAEIAKAESFTCAIVLGGPGGRRAEHGLATFEQAQAVEAEFNADSRFGRRAVIYAVRGNRSTPCRPETIALAREINPAL